MAQISVADVILAVDETLDSTQCGGRENCLDEKKCITHNLWADLNQHIFGYLGAVTLKQLVDEQKPANQRRCAGARHARSPAKARTRCNCDLNLHTGDTMAISVTENAAKQIRNQLAKRGKGLGLRVGVKKVGCSGFAYTFDYADEMQPGDHLFEAHDAKVVVDAEVRCRFWTARASISSRKASSRCSNSTIPMSTAPVAAARASTSRANSSTKFRKTQ